MRRTSHSTPTLVAKSSAVVPNGEFALELLNVSKTFRKYTLTKKSYSTLKTTLLDRLLRRSGSERSTLKALDDFSIAVPKGQSLGLIGRNGSGKSTLLKLIAGIYQPDSGCVRVNGRIAALIELGAGFHPDFTGRENIYLGGVMYGLSRKEIEARVDDIVKFAELEEFIDDPVRTYSSGMFMRLGFSLAVHTDPDILLIDEVLAVGDASFIHRCQERISEFKRQGKTMIFVTHDLESVTRWCDHAIWLHKGVVRAEGEPRYVVDTYLQDVDRTERINLERENEEQLADATVEEQPADEVEPSAGEKQEEIKRWGDRRVEITSVKLYGTESGDTYLLQSEEGLTVSAEYTVHNTVEDLVFGVAILRADGTVVFGTNTAIEGIEVPKPRVRVGGGYGEGSSGSCQVFIDRLGLTEGIYYIDIAAHRSDGLPYDYHHLLYKISVKNPLKFHGVWSPVHEWNFQSGAVAMREPALVKRGNVR